MANGNIPVIEKIKGTIESVKFLKAGQSQKNGQTFDWKLYEVVISGTKFRTFDSGYLKLLKKFGEWGYKKEMRQGRDGMYESRTLDNLPRPKVSDQFEEILENQKKILELLAQRGAGTDKPADFVEGPGPGDLPPEPERED